LQPAEPLDHGRVEFFDRRALTKNSRFSEEKCIAVLKQAEAGVKVAELMRKHGSKLKKMYAELSLTHEAFEDAVKKDCNADGTPRADPDEVVEHSVPYGMPAALGLLHRAAAAGRFHCPYDPHRQFFRRSLYGNFHKKGIDPRAVDHVASEHDYATVR
jgi:hypothetical protein